MKKAIMVLIGLFFGGGMMSAQKKILTLDDIFNSNQFLGKTVSDVQWLPDGKSFTFSRINSATGQADIYRHEVATGKINRIVDGDALVWKGQKITMTAYQTTGQQNILLITGPTKQIWRHSYTAPYFLFDIRTKQITALANGDHQLQNVTLSPDSKWVAFVKNNNLFVAEIGKENIVQLTNDGSFNILNGVFDWVYEEEFGRADAYRWSPDSKKIAFWRTDQTRVKTFYMLDEIPHYSKLIELKYPKVGEKNALIDILVVDITTGSIEKMDIGDNEDIYIPRIEWTNRPNILSIQRLNRKQNNLELLFADVATGKTRRVLVDQNEAWVDVTDDFCFLRQSRRIIWTSEKDGFRHIYLSDYDGNQLGQLTKGDWEVVSVIGVDESQGWVYFYGKKESPAHQDVYRVSLNGGEVERISTFIEGWHDAIFSPHYTHWIAFSSNVKTPTVVSLRKADGSLVRGLEENKIAALDEFDLVYPEFFEIHTQDGTALSAFMFKPKNFDPQQKYPVIVYGYGGPGSQTVVNRWGLGSRAYHLQQRVLWHNLMLQKGYLVFAVDNRGTGGRGKAFKNLAYGDLSKWAVHDQIEGAKYLAGLPYVDGKRIGFWGWSGGGYLSLMMLTRGAEYFKAGIAVAAVSDFRNYDTIWTERYMGLLYENSDGYNAANANEYANLLKGNLLIIHGSGDDNVHPQNALQFINKLIDHNKPFDMMLYPNRNHRISGGNTYRHLFTKMTHFFENNL
jgi:dipeptidyl-peptidase-4